MTADRTTAGLISKKDLFFFALFMAFFLLVFREFFFTNRVFYERDSTVVEVPVKKLTVQLLKEGNFALWTDAHGNGQPFLANPKNAVFYPTTWLYLFLPLFTAFKLHYLIHVILGWLGLYVLCGSYSLSKKASFLGASFFAFSGMYLSSFEFYNHIAALAWMPWVLWLLHRDARPGRARIVPLAFLWALMILAGAPEFILMTLFLAAGQAFFTAGAWKKKIALAVLSLLLASLISAAQLLPSIELLGRTERTGQSAQWPLELVQLFNLPFPHFLGNDREPGHNDFWGWHLFDNKFPLYYSLYMGVGALLLFLFGLRKPWDRRQKILLLAFFLFFLLSCGRYSPFFFLYRFIPLLSSIRYPIKFFLGAVFCLSVLAAFGFDRVTNAGKPGRKAVSFMAVAAGCGLPLFWLFKRPIIGVLNKLFIIDQDASFREFGRSVATGLVLLAVYALVFFLLRRSKGQARILGWALIALAVLDPAYHNRYVNPTVPASFYDTPPLPGLLAAPLAIYRDELYSPFLKETMGDNIKLLRFFRKSLYPFTGLGDGIRYVFNWDFYGTYSRRYLDLREAIKGLPPNGQFKVLKYIGCAAHIGYEPLFSRESAQRLQIEGVNVWLERIAETGASPFIAFRAVRAAKVRDKLGIFAGDGFDPLKEIVTEKDIILPDTLGNTDMKAGAVLIRKEVQGRGWYSASLPYEGIAVFPGNAAPGWHARIDGRRAEVFEANLFAKGVLVPAGEHEIVLRYLPASFLWGVVISLVSIGLVPAGVCILGRRPKGKARTALLVLFYIVLVILITPFIAFCMLTGLRDPLIAVGQWAMRVSRRILGIKVEVSGLDRIDPRTTLIFMPNHMSFLDGPLVMMLIPGAARVILKKSVLRLPVVGLGMRHVGFVPVDRKGIDGGKKSVARAASLMRERGYSFLVFPEGTRSRDGTLGAFRRGGFFLAVASGAPIVPVTIRGTRELMPKGQWFARRGTVKVAFHDPIPVTGYAADTMAGLMERVREAIVSAEGPAVGVKESARVSDSVTAVSSYRKAGLESEQGGREHENKAEKS